MSDWDFMMAIAGHAIDARDGIAELAEGHAPSCWWDLTAFELFMATSVGEAVHFGDRPSWMALPGVRAQLVDR